MFFPRALGLVLISCTSAWAAPSPATSADDAAIAAQAWTGSLLAPSPASSRVGGVGMEMFFVDKRGYGSFDSGGGLHFYWLLTEALDIRQSADNAAETEESVVAVLKQLAGIMAGDTSVCDLARIMRLPGSHNTKPEVMATNGDQPALATVLAADWSRRHAFSDLVE